ncbi:MAG: glutaredoxin domain-containing protein [Thermoleophilaceae bacterium]|jgi:glutaredoxin
MSERVMYVKPGCPYCDAARAGLREEDLEWEERDATTRADWRAELFSHTSNSGVVPTIVTPEGRQVGWPPGKG